MPPIPKVMSYWGGEHLLKTGEIPVEMESYEGYRLSKITSEFGFLNCSMDVIAEHM